jgi:hypothetical protein
MSDRIIERGGLFEVHEIGDDGTETFLDYHLTLDFALRKVWAFMHLDRYSEHAQ